MKKQLSGVFVALLLGLSGAASADSIVNVYQCELKDGVELDDVKAANSRWQKWINANVAGGGITSAIGTAIVGDQQIFLFVDSYPSLASWAAATEALQNSDDLDGLFDDLNECSESRLWRMEDTE